MYDVVFLRVFFFKQKTAYEMRISDWSSDVCSSDLGPGIMAWGRPPDSRPPRRADPLRQDLRRNVATKHSGQTFGGLRRTVVSYAGRSRRKACFTPPD